MAFSSFNSINCLIKGSVKASEGGLNVISSDSLAFYYDFESASRINSTLKNKKTGGTADATIVGSGTIQTATRSGIHNGSGSLLSAGTTSAPTNYIVKTTFANLTSTNQTMAFWIKTTSVSNPYVGRIFVCYMNNTLAEFSLLGHLYQVTTGRWVIDFRNSGNSSVYQYINGDYSVQYPNMDYVFNVWNHICLIKTGSSLAFYMNGSLKATVDNDTPIFSSTLSKFSVGAMIGDNNIHNGYIDDFRIYNRAITTTGTGTANELATLYASVL